MFLDVFKILLEPFRYLISIHEKIHVFYLLGFLLIAYALYCYSKNSFKTHYQNFWSYCFPKSIYWHRSARTDYGFFYFTKILFFLIPLYMIGSAASAVFLSSYLKPLANPFGLIELPNFAVNILFTVASLLAADLALFITHYLAHKIPLLWEFHKVHHSAEVLTPLTVYRMHPVDDIVAMSCVGIFTGFTEAVFFWIFPQKVSVVTIFGFDIAYFIYFLAGYHLRHSHIWFSYGPFLSRILVSPAQHQIHHSANPEHYDKNFGFIFAFWDLLTRSLIVPKTKMDIQFGLAHDEAKEFSSPLRLLFLPFKKIYLRFVVNKNKLASNSLKTILLVFVFLLSLCRFSYGESHSVFLEEMTWLEVQDAIESGKKIAIIPTGGTEQNGPHMVLGKHNVIARYTAGQIAERLGNALVAPVLPYVPEGDIEKQSGHMKYAGTISLPDRTYKEVLKSAAKSLFAHGFKVVCFIGDSGDSQAAQAKAASELNAIFVKKGQKAVQVSDYYFKNGQMDYLKDKNFSEEEIGMHAGIRDTSELLALDPNGVREDYLKSNKFSQIIETGSTGDARKASKEEGLKLLQLKIEVATEQIQRFLKENFREPL